MTTITSRAVAAAFASLIFASAALAQSTTTTPAPGASPAPATTPAKTKSTKAQTPESIACYKQADEKGLHGKARHKFHHRCVKDAKAAAAKDAK
jgi:hypothetical protein